MLDANLPDAKKMTNFFDNIFTRYPVKTKRLLEIMPGIFSWTLILSPVWGSLFAPYAIAYFILFFDVYWFYKSFSLSITAYIATKKIKEAESEDWLNKAINLENYHKVNHVVIIPNYTEGVNILRKSIKSIADQTFALKQIFVVLAMEEREEKVKERAKVLIGEFKDKFGGIFATYHPDILGEVKGKSSNEAYAGKIAYKELIEKGLIDIDFATISSVDADSIFDHQYFSYLTYKFLKDQNRHNKFWQSATVYYNNIWQVPAPTRIISFFGRLWRTAVLLHGDRLVANATYTLSFKLLKEIDFWDTDVIPEDYRIFFKAFYKKHGNIWIEPIFLKTSMDAAHSTSYIKSLKNRYNQELRWSWGVSDDPLFIKWWLTVPNVPFARKTIMLFHVVLDHFLWPVNWFIITVAANIMPFINTVFSRTTLGYNLPRLAGFILTICLLSLCFMIIINFRQSYNSTSLSKVRRLLMPLEFFLLPIVGFFLITVPALVSHTLLMIGKRIEYKVTEKL